MRIDFAFSGGGYAIVRKELPLDLPDNYELSLWIRGDAPTENLEVKLVDSTGENVWWRNQRDVELPKAWRRMSIKKRQITFAWGPRGGGELRRAAALEISVTAGSGGRGTVWLDDIVLEPRAPAAEQVQDLAHGSLLPLGEDQPHGRGQAVPALFLDFELLLAGARQRVELGLAPGLGGAPFRAQPLLLLEPMQGRVERSLVDLDGVSRDLLDALGDGVAVGGPEGQDLQDEHVQGALRDRESFGRHRVTSTFDVSR